MRNEEENLQYKFPFITNNNGFLGHLRTEYLFDVAVLHLDKIYLRQGGGENQDGPPPLHIYQTPLAYNERGGGLDF